MMRITRNNRAAGFSLIEVLLAVVVLSVGLLGLALLQAALIRAGAETKAQTSAIALAKQQIEDLKGFATLAQYRAIDSQAAALVSTDVDNDGTDDGVAARGGTAFTRGITVTRYVYRRDTNTFEAVANTLTNAQVEALDIDFEPGNEFKRVLVTVSWADAAGQTQSIAVEDAISALDPANSARIQTPPPGGPRGPRVPIFNPAGTAGVIPIAIGSGTDTAATNPRPEVVSRGNSTTVVETRFDVLTYSALNDSVALAQARVETAVVGCRCEYGAGVTGVPTTPMRPTYWNGVRYAAPVAATGIPASGPVTGNGNNAPVQSRLCNECCRDHHDTNTAEPLYDPYRAGAHEHYRLSGGSLVPAEGGGEYLEACRLIRVDGIMRVATDINSEHMGLVATTNTARSPVPDPTAAQNYEDFVLSYLDGRFVSGTAYNTIPTSGAGFSETIAAAEGLDEPVLIGITKPATGEDFRWLHSRGLYIDYLGSEARTRITEAKENCATQPASSSCVLPYVPFTTINTTELANWTDVDTIPSRDVIDITNLDSVAFGNPNAPVRGRVNATGAAMTDDDSNANTAMTHSNSALALMRRIDPAFTGIDPVDAIVAAFNDDAQPFRVTSGIATGASFNVTIAGAYPLSEKTPAVGWIVSPGSGNCPGQGNPNPYRCTTDSQLNSAVRIIVEDYVVSGSDPNAANPCDTRGNPQPASKPYCLVFRPADNTAITAVDNLGNVGTVTRANIDKRKDSEGTVTTSDDDVGEYAYIDFANLAPNASVTLTFPTPTRLEPTTYTCSGGNNRTITWDSPCDDDD